MTVIILLTGLAVAVAVAGAFLYISVKLCKHQITFLRACLVALISGFLYSLLCSFLPRLVAVIGGFIIFGALLKMHSTVVKWWHAAMIAVLVWILEIVVIVSILAFFAACLSS